MDFHLSFILSKNQKHLDVYGNINFFGVYKHRKCIGDVLRGGARGEAILKLTIIN